MAATPVPTIGIGAQVGLGILTVIDFFENRSVGWLTGIASGVAVAVSLWASSTSRGS